MLARVATQLNRVALLAFVALLPALAGVALAASGGPRTERVSVSSSGAQGKGYSDGPSLSGDGRLVAFSSMSNNLVPGDRNGKSDVFVRDLKTHKTTLVSVNSDGAQGDRSSLGPKISRDGRFVAFSSLATNLVAHDGNGQKDVFVHDLKSHETILVSISSEGRQGNGASSAPVISADGKDVAFKSSAGNLTAGDGNERPDVFVRQRDSHRTLRVSVGPAGAEATAGSLQPAISADGQRIAFTSIAKNLVPGDENGSTDVFVRDLRTNTTTLVSASSSGEQGNGGSRTPAISADGRFVAFESYTGNLVAGDNNHLADVFLRDLKTGTTTRISESPSGRGANDYPHHPGGVSAHGEYVVFVSRARNLVPHDTNAAFDAFIRDVANHETRRISVSTAGVQGNAKSFAATISADGRIAGFMSRASNLVPGDTNGRPDVFVRGPLQP